VVELGEPGHLPVELGTGGRGLRGGAVRVRSEASSQFLSGLLLSGPALPEGLEVEVVGDLVSAPYVRMTVEVMRAFGAVVEHDPGFRRLRVAPGGYVARRYDVEPDASAASYFLAAAALTAGRVLVPGLGPDSLQGDVGFAEVLVRMGATARAGADGLEVVGPERLRGIEVDLGDLSDTAQTLAAVAPFAESPTVVNGIGFIRAKETDRIAAVVTELRRLGVDAQEDPDGFTVHPGPPHGGLVRTYDDHRMAMSFALIGLRVPGILIADPGCVAKTYPRFWDDLRDLQTRRRAPGAGAGAGDP
jgi:3-phosphoshikimate 1-carboxyvinyltransferase